MLIERRRSTLGRQGVAIAAVAASLGAAGCGDNGTAGDSDTFRMAVVSVSTNYDPAVYEGLSSEANVGTASPLVQYKDEGLGGKTLQGPSDVRGEVAESWKRDADGNYVFTLREAKSPAGNTVTPEDVRWSFERVTKFDPIGQFLLATAGIDAENPITILDPRRVRVNVTEYNNLTLGALTWYSLSILDKKEIQRRAGPADRWGKKWLRSHSATFGPYQLASLTPGESIRLKANPNYWGGVPAMRNVTLRAAPDAGTRLLLVKTGKVDFAAGLDYEQFQAAADEGGGLKTVESLDANVDSLSLNNRRKPFDDALVRRAVNLAIDRDAIVSGPYRGFGTPAKYALTPTIEQPPPPPELAAERDLDTARRLLAEAGYDAGNPLRFTLSFSPTRGSQTPGVAALIQSQLAEVDVDVELRPVASSSQFQDLMEEHKLEAALWSSRPAIVDAGFVSQLTYSSSGLQREGYQNPELDRLTKLINTTPYGPRRDRYVSELQEILARDVPLVPLVDTIVPWVYREGVTGLWSNPDAQVFPQDVEMR